MNNTYSGTIKKNIVSAIAVFAALMLLMFAAVAFNLSQSVKAFADDGEDEVYTYTITLLSGNQGELVEDGIAVESNGATITYAKDIIIISGLELGDRVSFSNDVAKVDPDGKYYVKGIRMGGRDNKETENITPSIVVEEDQDYVVAYGLKGSLVEYTVRFVDTEGNPLLDDRKYFGNIGDSPVAAYVYVDGYRPQAYNLTGTLKEDPSENIFEFVYTRQEEPEAPEAPEEEAQPNEPNDVNEPAEQPATENPEPANNNANGVVAPAPAQPAAADAAGADAGAGDATTIDENENPTAEPEEVMNIDDTENPLASSVSHPAFSEYGNDQILWPVITTWILLVGGLIGFLIWFFMRKKREKELDAVVETYGQNL